jgi:hypothetical protein
MAGSRHRVVGTWLVKVTRKDQPGSGPHPVVMAFTEDGCMVERASGFVESAVGAWEPGDHENEFRFMFYRFFNSLKETTETDPQQGSVPPTFVAVQRVRSTNQLIGPNTFKGEGESVFLDTDLHEVRGPDGEPTPPICTTQDGVRMVVEKMNEVCE